MASYKLGAHYRITTLYVDQRQVTRYCRTKLRATEHILRRLNDVRVYAVETHRIADEHHLGRLLARPKTRVERLLSRHHAVTIADELDAPFLIDRY